MVKISEPTHQEFEQGYQICPCGDGVHLLQSGFEVDLHRCSQCYVYVADIDDFKTAGALEILSK